MAEQWVGHGVCVCVCDALFLDFDSRFMAAFI